MNSTEYNEEDFDTTIKSKNWDILKELSIRAKRTQRRLKRENIRPSGENIYKDGKWYFIADDDISECNLFSD